jgi:hypothetical protein
VIGSDDPGIAALAATLPGCITVPAGDVAALATEMGRLLSDALHAARLGRVNAEAAHVAHAPERLAERMELVYERAIAARRPHVRTREVAYSG